MKTLFKSVIALLTTSLMIVGCVNNSTSNNGALSSSNAEKVYVAPGEHDDFYAFVSGGFSGQLAVYGLPSGRLFKVIPVFSVDAEKAYGFNEETKNRLISEAKNQASKMAHELVEKMQSEVQKSAARRNQHG